MPSDETANEAPALSSLSERKRRLFSPGNLTKLLGLAIFAVLVYKVDWDEILLILGQVEAGRLLVAMAAMIVAISLKAWRWRGILRACGLRISLGRAWLVYYDAIFIGLVTPGRLGEVIKAFYLQRHHGVSLTVGMLTVVLDRALDIASLFAACLVTSFLYRDLVGWVLPAVLLPVNIVIGLALLWPRSVILILRPWGLRLGKLRMLSRLRTLDYEGFADLARRGLRPGAWVLTALSYSCFLSVAYFLALTLDIRVPFAFLVMTITGASLLTALSYLGFGPREVAVIFLFGLQGISPEAGMAFSLLVAAVCYIMFIFVGLVVWIAHPIPLTPKSLLQN
jgi:glycosyltransferase 2 family protein